MQDEVAAGSEWPLEAETVPDSVPASVCSTPTLAGSPLSSPALARSTCFSPAPSLASTLSIDGAYEPPVPDSPAAVTSEADIWTTWRETDPGWSSDSDPDYDCDPDWLPGARRKGLLV